MYTLSTKVQILLKDDAKLRMTIAMTMGIGENAITMSLRRTNGKSIANHYDAVNKLIDETGLCTKDIRKFETETTTA
jgi:hypothetical protein